MPEFFASSGLLPSLVAAVLAAGLTYLLTPSALRLALRLGAVDQPDTRKSHAAPTPRLGGAAMTLGALLGASAAFLVFTTPHMAEARSSQVLAFLGATGLIFFIGAVDDVRGLSPGPKLLGHVVAAAIILWTTGAIEHLNLPFVGSVDLGIMGYLASMLWIVGITNSVNLIDGLDGLAGGIGLIIAASISVIALFQGNQPGTAIVAAAMAGACLGFLPHNWTPASIFMGDSGSLTMGFVLAVLTHSSSLKSSTTVAILVPILALGLPAIDTLLVMAFRFATGKQDRLTRRIARMFRADRQHVHHLLLVAAPKRQTVVPVLYGIVGVFCLAALAASLSNNLPLGVALLIMEGGVILLVRKAGLKAQARALAAAQREQARERLRVADSVTTTASMSEQRTLSAEGANE